MRNAPTKLMKQLDYGKNYLYAHDYPGNFVRQQFLPDGIQGTRFWHPGNNASEAKMMQLYNLRWGDDGNE